MTNLLLHVFMETSLLNYGLFHLINIHPPRKSVNYVGGVNNEQKLMCPRGVQLKSQIVSRGV